MNERCQHMPIRWELHQWAPVHAWCSPYQGPGIDISRTLPAHLPVYQRVKEHTPKSSLLHIPASISQPLPSRPSFISSYQGGDLDITGGSISRWSEPQPVTSSVVRTAVHYIAPPTQHTGAHHRQQPALRVRDRSGKPGGLSSGRGLGAHSPTRGAFGRGARPNKNTLP